MAPRRSFPFDQPIGKARHFQAPAVGKLAAVADGQGRLRGGCDFSDGTGLWESFQRTAAARPQQPPGKQQCRKPPPHFCSNNDRLGHGGREFQVQTLFEEYES